MAVDRTRFRLGVLALVVSSAHCVRRPAGIVLASRCDLSKWPSSIPKASSGATLACQRIGWNIPRGGAGETEIGEEDGDYDEDVDEYDNEDEYDDEDADEPENVQQLDADDSGVQIEVNVEKYDEMLVPSPMMGLYSSFGVMLLARKVNLFSPTLVRIARFAYIAYLVLLQVFLFYVRVQARFTNDRTPVTMNNPLSSILQSQFARGDTAGMMKNLASSFLSSQSNVYEYDMKQARSMQSGVLMNMMFMWFLHFKMEQVQPLLIQTVNGLVQLFYSPLFQVYVLRRNLERPFKNPTMKKLEDMQSNEAAVEEVAGLADNVATHTAGEIAATSAVDDAVESSSASESEAEDDHTASVSVSERTREQNESSPKARHVDEVDEDTTSDEYSDGEN